jgi:hypothetical protein
MNNVFIFATWTRAAVRALWPANGAVDVALLSLRKRALWVRQDEVGNARRQPMLEMAVPVLPRTRPRCSVTARPHPPTRAAVEVCSIPQRLHVESLSFAW